jgi:membrane protease YdiL (CAAX protease family)
VQEAAEDQKIRWGMGDALLGIVASLFLSVIAVGVADGLTDTPFDELPLWATAVLQVPLWLGLLGVAWTAVKRKGSGSLRADYGLEMRWRDVPIGLGAGLLGQLAIGFVVITLYDLFGVDTDRVGETAEELADRAAGAIDVTLLVLIVVVGAPIVEEIFYRGLWMRSIEHRSGNAVVAVGVSSVVFGLVHFQPYDLIALSLAGVLFGTLARRAGRLGPAIWAHVAFNLTAVVALLTS